MQGGKKLYDTVGDHERRLQRLKEILDELVSLTDLEETLNRHRRHPNWSHSVKWGFINSYDLRRCRDRGILSATREAGHTPKG